MTNDELNFIHESQSRTTANLEALAARQDKFQTQLEDVATLLTSLTQTTFNVIGVLSGRINEIAEQGRKTDERISAVVTMVEKWIAEDQRRRNGNTH
jgi:hypothetical protein